MSNTIVLIHGAWVTAASMENFRQHYAAKGYTVLAPAWPGLDRSPADIRRNPDGLAKLSLGKIIEHYASIIQALTERPIIIGHSYGGLITQMLLDRGYGAVGVSIDPAPAAGILAGPKALRSAFPVFAAIGGWGRAVTMSFAAFRWSLGHNLSEAAARKVYEEAVIPAPGKIYYQSVFGFGSGINWANEDRAPLLLIAGEKDRTIEVSMVQQNFRRYARSSALTGMKVFPGRSHLLIAEPGWEEVADYALLWAIEHSGAKVVPMPARIEVA